mgnify:FL=1
MRFSLDLIETAYNKLMTSVQYTGEVSFFTRYEFFASYMSLERKRLQTIGRFLKFCEHSVQR